MVLLLYFQRKSSRVSKAVFDVTVMAAVLPVIIAISGEALPAMCTSELIYCISIYLVLMGIPPLHPALIRAEFLFLPAGILPDRTSAALTRLHSVFLPRPSSEVISLTKAPYCVDRYSHRVSDSQIPYAFNALSPDFRFFYFSKSHIVCILPHDDI